MLFGRSLFAGALVAGLVSASGAALCSATVSGAAQGSYLGKANGLTTASASGKALRAAVAQPVAAACKATATGAGHSALRMSGLAVAVAECHGYRLAAVYGRGNAVAATKLDGLAFRRFRFWATTPARCEARGRAEAFGYVYAYGTTALARATAFGTTYYVGHSSSVAEAILHGAAIRTIGVRQRSVATAHGSAGAINTAGALAKGQARAVLLGDAAVRRNGKRRFECFGSASAISAVGPATTVVFQPQMAIAIAAITADAVQVRGAIGPGMAVAGGVGVGVVGQTAVQGANAGGTAIMVGRARRSAFVQGNETCLAICAGQAKWLSLAKGRAVASALLTSDVWLLVRSKPALADSVGRGAPERVVIGAGIADAFAQGTGYNQVNDLILAPLDRTLRVPLGERSIFVGSEPRLLAA